MTELEKKKLFESEKFEAEYTYTGSDLGAVYTKESTTFKVWSPTADKVMLKLYLTGSDEEKTASDVKIADKFENAAELEMDKAENGVWQMKVFIILILLLLTGRQEKLMIYMQNQAE